MARHGLALPDRVQELDGLTKTAILLLNLDAHASAKLLERLPPERIDEMTRILGSIGEIPQHLSAAVISEFHRLGFARPTHENQAAAGVSPATSPASGNAFSLLHQAEAADLLTFIQDEHPQTIALILSHLPHHRASAVLGGLPGPRQLEVVRRIAAMEPASPDIIHEVEEALQLRVANLPGAATGKFGGVETVAEVLNLCDRATERAIMDGIRAENPELVEDIRRLMFVFEDMVLVNDKGIQAVLKEIDHDELALALKTASDALKEKIFSNMSARASDLIREEMEYMGPVRVIEVEAAQQRIVDIVRRLEDAGEAMIGGRAGDGEIVV